MIRFRGVFVRSVVTATVVVTAALFGSVGPAAAAEVSVIASSDGANLRSCPRLPAYGVTTGECSPIGHLDDGAAVSMNCWVEGEAPWSGASRKWFWVTVLDGDLRGWSGWVWSDLVGRQKADAGNCGPWEQMSDPAHPFVPMEIHVDAGPVGPVGLRYAISITGAAPDTAYLVSCFDSVDYEQSFYDFWIRTDASGSAYTQSQCYSADGPDHWVEVDGQASDVASW